MVYTIKRRRQGYVILRGTGKDAPVVTFPNVKAFRYRANAEAVVYWLNR